MMLYYFSFPSLFILKSYSTTLALYRLTLLNNLVKITLKQKIESKIINIETNANADSHEHSANSLHSPSPSLLTHFETRRNSFKYARAREFGQQKAGAFVVGMMNFLRDTPSNLRLYVQPQ